MAVVRAGRRERPSRKAGRPPTPCRPPTGTRPGSGGGPSNRRARRTQRIGRPFYRSRRSSAGTFSRSFHSLVAFPLASPRAPGHAGCGPRPIPGSPGRRRSVLLRSRREAGGTGRLAASRGRRSRARDRLRTVDRPPRPPAARAGETPACPPRGPPREPGARGARSRSRPAPDLSAHALQIVRQVVVAGCRRRRRAGRRSSDRLSEGRTAPQAQKHQPRAR